MASILKLKDYIFSFKPTGETLQPNQPINAVPPWALPPGYTNIEITTDNGTLEQPRSISMKMGKAAYYIVECTLSFLSIFPNYSEIAAFGPFFAAAGLFLAMNAGYLMYVDDPRHFFVPFFCLRASNMAFMVAQRFFRRTAVVFTENFQDDLGSCFRFFAITETMILVMLVKDRGVGTRFFSGFVGATAYGLANIHMLMRQEHEHIGLQNMSALCRVGSWTVVIIHGLWIARELIM